MQKILIDALLAILTKLLTVRFISKLVVRSLAWLASLTDTEIDDGIVADVAEGLGVEDYK